MSRPALKDRNPDYPGYDRKGKFKIWRAKLVHEFFYGRKPSTSQKVMLDTAAIMILNLRAVEAEHREAGKPLPQSYWSRHSKLMSLLEKLKPRIAAKPGKPSGSPAEPDLASIIGGKE